MSEIFYSQVDAGLQAELNARGRAGKTARGNSALDFMIGKIANIELIAYDQVKKENKTFDGLRNPVQPVINLYQVNTFTGIKRWNQFRLKLSKKQ